MADLQISLRNAASYKSDMGRLKNALSTRREGSTRLEIELRLHDDMLVTVLMQARDLYIVGFRGAGDTVHVLKDDARREPLADGAVELPFGGSHSELGTGTRPIDFAAFRGIEVLSRYSGKRDVEAVKAALSVVVVALSEASRFRSVQTRIAEVLLGPASTRQRTPSISADELRDWVAKKFTDWKNQSGKEGTFPDVNVHWRPS
jgi:hypothetical protein